MNNKSPHTRNWSKYNRALKQRGAITFWVDKSCISAWYTSPSSNQSKGRPRHYSDIAVQSMLILKYVYKQSLRATQGLFDSLGFPVKAMSYTQLCRRQKQVKLPSLPTARGNLHIAIDGTGLKVYGEGEWKVRCHGYAKRRNWMKLHIGIDVGTQMIVCKKLTDNHCSEHNQLDGLLKNCKTTGGIKEVLTDAGYDYHESYDVIKKYGGHPLIAPNCNPEHKPKQLKTLRTDKPRDYFRWLQEQIGVKEWKILSGYHRRSLVETAFYRLKQLLGNNLSARNFTAQEVEISLKCFILNRINEIINPSTI